jgi:chlorobactene lauroyltransferase
MIPALDHPIYTPLILNYCRWSLKQHVAGLYWHMEDAPIDSKGQFLVDETTLFYASHHSWWDGYALGSCMMALNLQYRVMMLSKELYKYQFLRYAGCFGLNQHQISDIKAALRYASNELQKPRLGLVMFPSGSITQASLKPQPFAGGISNIALQTQQPVVLRPVAVRIEHRIRQKPEYFLRIGSRQVVTGTEQAKTLQNQLRCSLEHQASILNHQLEHNQLAEYRTLFSGSAGVAEAWDGVRRRLGLQLSKPESNQ